MTKVNIWAKVSPSSYWTRRLLDYKLMYCRYCDLQLNSLYRSLISVYKKGTEHDYVLSQVKC